MDTLELAKKLHNELKAKYCLFNRHSLILKSKPDEFVPGTEIKKSKEMIYKEGLESFNNVIIILSSEEIFKPLKRAFCANNSSVEKAGEFYLKGSELDMNGHDIYIISNHNILSIEK